MPDQTYGEEQRLEPSLTSLAYDSTWSAPQEYQQRQSSPFALPSYFEESSPSNQSMYASSYYTPESRFTQQYPSSHAGPSFTTSPYPPPPQPWNRAPTSQSQVIDGGALAAPTPYTPNERSSTVDVQFPTGLNEPMRPWIPKQREPWPEVSLLGDPSSSKDGQRTSSVPPTNTNQNYLPYSMPPPQSPVARNGVLQPPDAYGRYDNHIDDDNQGQATGEDYAQALATYNQILNGLPHVQTTQDPSYSPYTYSSLIDLAQSGRAMIAGQVSSSASSTSSTLPSLTTSSPIISTSLPPSSFVQRPSNKRSSEDKGQPKPKRAVTIANPHKNGVTTTCLGCGATETPEWRRGPMGPRTLCNACGLVHRKWKKKQAEDAKGDRGSSSNGDGTSGS